MSTMQKVFNALIIVTLLFSGYTYYKVTTATATFETAIGATQSAVITIACRAQMYELLAQGQAACPK